MTSLPARSPSVRTQHHRKTNANGTAVRETKRQSTRKLLFNRRHIINIFIASISREDQKTKYSFPYFAVQIVSVQFVIVLSTPFIANTLTGPRVSVVNIESP